MADWIELPPRSQRAAWQAAADAIQRALEPRIAITLPASDWHEILDCISVARSEGLVGDRVEDIVGLIVEALPRRLPWSPQR